MSSLGAGGFTIAPNAGQSIIAGTIISDVWTARETSQNWQSITSSADGSKLAAVANNEGIYTSTIITVSGASLTTAELVYAGGGV